LTLIITENSNIIFATNTVKQQQKKLLWDLLEMWLEFNIFRTTQSTIFYTRRKNLKWNHKNVTVIFCPLISSNQNWLLYQVLLWILLRSHVLNWVSVNIRKDSFLINDFYSYQRILLRIYRLQKTIKFFWYFFLLSEYIIMFVAFISNDSIYIFFYFSLINTFLAHVFKPCSST